MHILGISCFYHDSAACLVRNGEIAAAAQEERFSRRKHDAGFPRQAIDYCLAEAGITIHDLDLAVFYDKPFLKFERILETSLAYAPAGFKPYLKAMPVWLKQKLWMPQIISRETGYQGKILYAEHHQSHAASAFYPSPFSEAAFLTVDAVGEWATTSFGLGRGSRIQIKKEIHFPHSLGLLYSAFTYYTGFKVNSGEYKLMGLAPYGRPKYVDIIYKHLVDLKEDGSLRLNMKYFNYAAGLTMTNRKFHDLFGGPPREPESELTQKDMDLARSIQAVTEEAMLRLARHVYRETGQKYLCLAGGAALNCVANGRILREGPFTDIWIQPASGDAGGALGAALLAWHEYGGHKRQADGIHDSQKGSYLGPEFSRDEIKQFLADRKAPHQFMDDEELFNKVAGLIAQEKVIGWFQGKMEFGPRSLGSRSILGDARSVKMQKEMNLKIKFRESFRPFAPSVLADQAADYFEIDRPSPYMLLTAYIKKDKRKPVPEEQEQYRGLDQLNVARSVAPAITHVDYSARLQTVDKGTNPRYDRVIRAFYELTGCPVIINTSFNVRGEPIVCSPKDAYICFRRTNMDYLVLGNYLLDKKQQPQFKEIEDWRSKYELD